MHTSLTDAGVPHKVQVQAATVAGLGESREVEKVLFSKEQGTVQPANLDWIAIYVRHTVTKCMVRDIHVPLLQHQLWQSQTSQSHG